METGCHPIRVEIAALGEWTRRTLVQSPYPARWTLLLAAGKSSNPPADCDEDKPCEGSRVNPDKTKGTSVTAPVALNRPDAAHRLRRKAERYRNLTISNRANRDVAIIETMIREIDEEAAQIEREIVEQASSQKKRKR